MRRAVRGATLAGLLVLVGACADGAADALAPTTTTATTTVTTTMVVAGTTTTTAPAVTTSTVVGAAARCTTVEVAAGAGVTLAAERCEPAGGAGPVPAALVLNGCGGYLTDAGITSLIARRLADHGVLALRLDYLGVAPAAAYTYCDSVEVAAVAPKIVTALAAVVDGLRADPAVDPARLGAVGYSLGGLAATLAQLGGGGFADVPSAGFGAVGLLSPVVHGELIALAAQGKTPPLGLVVGSADLVVGSKATVALGEAAAAGGVDVVLDVVEGNGHTWAGVAADDAADALAGFLASRLLAVQPGERT